MGLKGPYLDVYVVALAAIIGVSPRVDVALAVDPNTMGLVSSYCKGKGPVKTIPAAAIATDVVVVHVDGIASPVIGGDGYLSIAFGLWSLRIGRVGRLGIVTGIVVWGII